MQSSLFSLQSGKRNKKIKDSIKNVCFLGFCVLYYVGIMKDNPKIQNLGRKVFVRNERKG